MWFRSSRNLGNQLRPFRPRLEVLDDRCLLSGGVLDPTFGSGGMVTTNVGAVLTSDSAQTFSGAFAVATYPSKGTANDGKIVAAGVTTSSVKFSTNQPNYDFAVVRYDLDGTLDKSFGGSGIVVTDLGTFTDEAFDVLIQPDGKVVAVGETGNNSSGRSLAVVRYNADGSLDTSFGGSTAKGKVITSISNGSFDIGLAAALEADGKIVVAGTTQPKNARYTDLFLVRYNADGSLDTSFGCGGKVTHHFASWSINSTYDYGNGVDLAIDAGAGPLDPNAGKIVVEAQLNNGSAVGSTAVLRYNPNGSPDSSFGGGAGYVTLSALGGKATAAVAVGPDDRIVVAGNDASGPFGGLDIALAHLNVNGTLDVTFGSGGIVVTPLPTQQAAALALQPDGKILVAGVTDNSMALVRYNAVSGSLDTSFGDHGVATATGVSMSNYRIDAALEPDGRIAVAGTSPYNPNGTFAVARFVAAGPQIGSFTASPNPVTAGSSLTLTASSIRDSNPNSTITQVAFYLDNNNDGILEPGTDTLLGYATQTSPGVWTFTFTVNLSPGTYTLFAQAEDTYGVFGDPVLLALTVQ